MWDSAGMLATQMAIHIAAMNVAAPLVALAWRAIALRPGSFASWLPAACVAQLCILWLWHLPGAFEMGLHSSWSGPAMLGPLFLCALLFWRCVLDAADCRVWSALGALLATGKLFCLLGVLLVFAPRPIYPLDHTAFGISSADAVLADQQLAGLLMLVACPLSYVTAAIIIAERWLRRLEPAPPALGGG